MERHTQTNYCHPLSAWVSESTHVFKYKADIFPSSQRMGVREYSRVQVQSRYFPILCVGNLVHTDTCQDIFVVVPILGFSYLIG